MMPVNNAEQRRSRSSELCLKDENGSIAPLLIGLTALSLSLCLVACSALSLFVFQQRLTTLAESLALAEKLQVSYPELSVKLTSKTISQPDGQTTQVKICANWQAPFRLPIISDRLNQSICSSAAARLGK
jgi:hypothetical protein